MGFLVGVAQGGLVLVVECRGAEVLLEVLEVLEVGVMEMLEGY